MIPASTRAGGSWATSGSSARSAAAAWGSSTRPSRSRWGAASPRRSCRWPPPLDPRAIQRFQLEAQVAGWLQHPRIVPVYAVGIVDDVPYLRDAVHRGGQPGRPDRRAARARRPRHGPARRPIAVRRVARARWRRACCRAGSPRRAATPTADRHHAPVADDVDTPATTAPPCRFAAGRISARSPGWASRRPRRSATPTTRGSFTATSSRPTCCSTAAATSGSPTSAWPTCRATPA